MIWEKIVEIQGGQVTVSWPKKLEHSLAAVRVGIVSFLVGGFPPPKKKDAWNKHCPISHLPSVVIARPSSWNSSTVAFISPGLGLGRGILLKRS